MTSLSYRRPDDLVGATSPLTQNTVSLATDPLPLYKISEKESSRLGGWGKRRKGKKSLVDI